jgi:hypothetical protein
MRVGFTGTENGMTVAQKQCFVYLLGSLNQPLTEFHHGDCIGADAQAHDLVVEHYSTKIVIHPPIISDKRAFKVTGNPTLMPCFDYMKRNLHIVVFTDLLIATPRQPDEVLRSGTWATVRRAKKARKQIRVIRPDGGIELYGM